MTEADKASLETKCIPVQSTFKDTIYAIDKHGKGMWIISGNSVLPVLAENVQAFALEMMDVWDIYKSRTVR